jgi:hypothetical protein
VLPYGEVDGKEYRDFEELDKAVAFATDSIPQLVEV